MHFVIFREMIVKDAIHTANAVYIDGILLSPSMINKINWFQTLNSLPEPKASLKALVHLHYYYRGKNPDYPHVGDTRVHFQCAGIPQGSTLALVDKVSCLLC